MYIFVIYDTNMRSNSKVWILDYSVFALWGYNNSDDHWDCLYEEIFEIDLQDYFKSFLYPLIATIAMILISGSYKMVFKRNNWRFYRNISMCFSIFGSCICCSQKAVIKYYSDNKKKKYSIL